MKFRERKASPASLNIYAFGSIIAKADYCLCIRYLSVFWHRNIYLVFGEELVGWFTNKNMV